MVLPPATVIASDPDPDIFVRPFAPLADLAYPATQFDQRCVDLQWRGSG